MKKKTDLTGKTVGELRSAINDASKKLLDARFAIGAQPKASDTRATRKSIARMLTQITVLEKSAK